jgi:hypothetical protein
MSGKLNELINLLFCKVNAPACRADQRRIELQPLSGTVLFSFLQCALNSCKDQLSGRTSLLSRSLMELPVQIAGKIDRCPNGAGLHILIMPKRLK